MVCIKNEMIIYWYIFAFIKVDENSNNLSFVIIEDHEFMIKLNKVFQGINGILLKRVKKIEDSHRVFMSLDGNFKI